MEHYTKLQDFKKQPVFRTRRGVTSNIIYTFDIETSSIFHYPDGWDIFDYSKNSDYYTNIEKAGVMYIWQFSIEDKVYYGRRWDEFADVLEQISDRKIRKVIYVHNLAWEFQFLINIITERGWSVSGLIARKSRKPIAFIIDELNIQFRCSYCLTNLSLNESAKKYTKVKKAVGDLDYNVLRSYKTKLTDKEMYYCEMDCIALYNVIKYFRNEYGSVQKIPYTQTGEVRRAFSKYASRKYQNKVRSLHESVENYTYLMSAFSGGLTHANRLYSGYLQKEVGSFDISSSYPFQLCKKYPMSTFTEVDVENHYKYPHSDWAVIYTVEYKNLKCKYFNAYIPSYKAIGGINIRADSGRVFKADTLQIIITDIDFDVIQRSYDFSQLNILSMKVAHKDYLPKDFLNFMLDLYVKKTTLKNVTSPDGSVEKEYQNSKGRLNALFGACCFNIVKSGATFDSLSGEWQNPKVDKSYMEKKLQETKDAYTQLFTYSWGCWCTAYGREQIYSLITASKETDIDSIYYDTDSDKMLNYKNYLPLIEKMNKQADEQLKLMCRARNIDFAKTRPKDMKGIPHPLGHFEIDGIYDEFKTMRSKCYAYKDKSGLHCTIAGVNKKASVSALNDNLDNLVDGLVFNYEQAKKSILNYIDNQPHIQFTDKDGNVVDYDDQFGICLQPTTYTLGISEEYDLLCAWAVRHLKNRRDNNGI